MTLERMLEEALKIGEAHGEQAVEFSFRNRDLKRAMWRAIHQLKVGKTEAAKETLEEAIAHDNQ